MGRKCPRAKTKTVLKPVNKMKPLVVRPLTKKISLRIPLPQCDLLEAYQKVDSRHRCPAQSERKICIHHGDEKAAQACSGDSGGPLIMDQGGYGVVIGVASYITMRDCPPEDIKCLMDARCNKDGVSVYTKVSAYLPWIKKTTGQGKNST